MVKRALISVSDKTGIVELGKELESLGIEIISTGGTYNTLKNAGVKVTGISDVTGFPECLDGRVKTLHPVIHAGILAMRSNPEHMEQIKKLNIETIDLVIINLYPFKQTILKEGVELHEAIENIDIGGPTMLRAAAKNYQDVAVVVDPEDYETVLNELKSKKDILKETKFRLAWKVFEHTSHYDTLIAGYLRDKANGDKYPKTLTITFEKAQDMRYGENPHQSAVFYKEVGKNAGTLASAVQLHGKELSFNNINDANGALELLKEFEEPTVVAVKHTNPCGVGSADTVLEAYIKAYDCDPVSIYGGIVAINREVDAKTAEEINKIFVEILMAPSFSQEALEILKSKKNIRILQIDEILKKYPEGTRDYKKVGGGILVQDVNSELLNQEEMKVVTKVQPPKEKMDDLMFAWKVVKHMKSNAIALVKDKQTVGLGPGQTNRVWSTSNAAERAGEKAKGAVLASDAYLPFADNVEAAAKAGITAIIQPGGSIRDQDAIDACDKAGIGMIFTGVRHFKH
ncbi:MAG: bifunctional phosphoribosylaminoimidazolecarboxamide formyltransferase/IMP cyclohydrolase [Deltaproteobacteria bacterium]